MSNYDAGQWSNSDVSGAFRQTDHEILQLKAKIERLKAENADLLNLLRVVDEVLQEYIEFLDAERYGNDDEVELLVKVQEAVKKLEVNP